MWRPVLVAVVAVLLVGCTRDPIVEAPTPDAEQPPADPGDEVTPDTSESDLDTEDPDTLATDAGDPGSGGDEGPPCEDACEAEGAKVCAGDGAVRTCVPGGDGCLVLSEPVGCPAPDSPCQDAVCDAGECVLELGPGWCFIDGDCVEDDAPAAGSGGCSRCVALASQTTWTPVQSGAPCSTTECVEGQSCADGACAGGALILCDDDNPCTEDDCDSEGGCVFAPAPASCDDGDACTLADECDDGICVGPGVMDCDDGNPCTDTWCEAGEGCLGSDNAEPCADGSVCTDGDSCVDGGCLPGAPLACDDALDCTADSCDPEDGCNHQPDAALCDDANPCTVDFCEPGAGCLYEPLDTTCDDGNPCTSDDSCADGVCQPGVPVCECEKDADCPNDGNPCDGVPVCDTSGPAPDWACVNEPSLALVCDGDDGNACTKEVCDPSLAGCATVDVVCDDDKVCTVDTCDPVLGCQYADSAICDDENPCTIDECVDEDGAPSCMSMKKCPAGDLCSELDGECFTCEATGIDFTTGGYGFDTAASTSCKGATSTPLHWGLVTLDQSGGQSLRACADSSLDQLYLGALSLDDGDFVMTFPGPIASLQFTYRQVLNWGKSGPEVVFEVNGASPPVTFDQISGDTSETGVVEASFSPPVSTVSIGVASGAGIAASLGLLNLSYDLVDYL